MAEQPKAYDAKATDPLLLQRHSEVKSYQTSRFTYPGLRIFYRPHPKFDQLPTDPAPLPLLVCLHGLGGSVAQFDPLLTSLTNNASCLAIDLPGCGVSDFAPTCWDAYTTEALLELLELIIDEYRIKVPNGHDQGVILIGHSMGTVLAARLANKQASHKTAIASHVLGVVGICPPSGPPPEDKVATFRKLLWIPTWLFNLWRRWDQWGGAESASVKRFVGPDADLMTRQMQDRFNKQSRTPVFRRMAWGSLPTYVDGIPTGGLFGEPTWSGLDVPVFLVGGEKDTVVSAAEVEKISKLLELDVPANSVATTDSAETVVDAAAPVSTTSKLGDRLPDSIDAIKDKDFDRKSQLAPSETYEDPTTPPSPQEPASDLPPQALHPKKLVKTLIMPSPASHALLYTPKTVRVLSGLICDFLQDNITGRFDLAWQLQYLSREGKWDVKNLNKWKSVCPVSEPIEGVFRAMKTMREVDEDHSPKAFAAKWGGVIKDIIDISHDTPVYDPHSLEREGIMYHKFPTVSKIPPSDEEVETFINLVDRIRADQKAKAKELGWGECFIGVHCHYGFNRTGYFIVCYLVERCGLEVEQAIQAFATARPNGIRHSHFLDKLCQRYSGLEK